MSDNEIRQILIERKRAMKRHRRLHEIKEAVEGFVGFGLLFVILFMISVVGA